MAKKDKKKGGDYWDEEDEELDTTAQEFGAPDANGESNGNADEEAAGIQTASAEDLYADDSLMGALKRSKKRKDEKKAEEAAEAAAKSEPVLQVKSKKEKEKEKKEREKAKKRAQAERKKAAPVLDSKKKGGNKDQASDAGSEASSDSEAAVSSEAAASAPAPSAKAKKLTGAAALLQKQLAARKAREEAQRQAEEEERKRMEAEEARLEEEERLKEEARLRKKEKEKQKRDELRSQGKLLTKKQKEQQQLQERRRQQLLASGVQVAGLEDGEASKPKRVVYDKKKKTQKSDSPEPEAVAVAASEVKPEPKEEQEPTPEATPEPEEEDAVNSWENEIAEEDQDEDVLDDWEAELEEETEKVEKTDKTEKVEKTEGTESASQKSVEKTTAQTPQTETDQSVLEKGATISAERKAELTEKREERLKGAKARATGDLRSPICCILGHVDTGKTKLLDKVRQTNVQEGEAGGITQQIGATYFPIDAIEKKTKVMEKYVKPQYHVPGLLVIDTPGHESFTNLRSRGSSLCNIAILVVDIMHGLEPQTLESIRLLRDRKTPFVVAVNKIDRLYGWEVTPNNSFRDSFSKQKSSVQREFQDRLERVKVEIAEQGLNSELYFQNKNLSRTVSLVPTSAVTGEGVPDLLYLLLELTQSRMSKQLMYLSELEATILEVKVIEGLGTTIDVVLSNGILREGDRIVLCGMNGPIATNVRALLTPQPLRELRIKSTYVHHKEVKAALGVKISAPDLDKAVAGSRLLLVGPDDDEDELMDDVMDDLTGLLDTVDKSGTGVCVQASTLGSLEALLDFLKDMKIPVMSISIGPVFKRDVMRATTMLDKAKEYAVMLCFDVRIDKEAEQYAAEQGITIFSADIIYHLFDSFTAYQKKLLEERKKANIHDAVYPCVLKTIQIINKRNPMIIGVDVIEGSLRVGTPISVVKPGESGEKTVYNLGRVVSLEVNHKSVDVVRKGQANAGVAMRLETAGSGFQPTWGRHIDEKDNLYSLISRRSIDVLKDPAFRDDVAREDWLLIKNLKPIFDIK